MTTRATTLEVVRAPLGLTELLLPNQVAEHLLGHPADARERIFIRILGARHLLQAVILLMAKDRIAHRIGAVVDVIHAGTMVAVAATDPRRKTSATVNAAIAVVFAGGETR
ncbi:hypothetical protein AX769_21150 (plasmid) [Frondihabitans sp. PAMC 28766]|uniref:hypothetical protein n=1 Tax=Frondihabitans sp. PAMC 28766 TaxID=1795630 RepID=UPI00078B9F36|nr:hypothetical protein [Frondihabitans sp. PAMC 28766]AMM22647.1 hypothetical protein AX769_21150 [Frondihabitans sp. PAMC 28766]